MLAIATDVIADRTTRPESEPAATPTTPTPLPPRLGRYLVIKGVGCGGMGVVFAAYDPDLDRKVAVKVLHATASDDARARLLREAQAMAKLCHPNVVPVHDVGTVHDRVFLAMDYIKGETLKEWSARRPRSWREVVAKFVQAGRGLAAAHAAGLIHRDFKPENVLVGRDGGVRVVDFGLAKDQDDDLDTDPGNIRTTAVPMDWAKRVTDVTEQGIVMGTPAYMSPEQFRGGHTDARSDQFSYCAALYEGLYRERPFEADSRMELAARVTKGVVRPAPSDTKVPSWLRRIVLRGLDPRADNRWPSMDALLDELDRAPRRRRKIAGSVSGAAAAAFIAVSAIFAGEQLPVFAAGLLSGSVAGLVAGRLAALPSHARGSLARVAP